MPPRIVTLAGHRYIMRPISRSRAEMFDRKYTKDSFAAGAHIVWESLVPLSDRKPPFKEFIDTVGVGEFIREFLGGT